MLQCVFIEFDNVIFPSTCLSRQYDYTAGRFNVFTKSELNLLESVDDLIMKLIMKHISTTRFRILTHSSPTWIQQVVAHLPNIRRFIDWNYVQLVYCDNYKFEHKLYQIISREPAFDMYHIISDNPKHQADLLRVHDYLKLGKKVRSILTLFNPTTEELYDIWDRMGHLLIELMGLSDASASRHFVTTPTALSTAQKPKSTNKTLTDKIFTALSPREKTKLSRIDEMNVVESASVGSVGSVGSDTDIVVTHFESPARISAKIHMSPPTFTLNQT